MAEARIQVGNCGFTTTIRASVDDAYEVTLEVESECPAVRNLVEALPPLNALGMGRAMLDSPVYQAANDTIKHLACVVPAVIVRTVEVAAGMALPEETHIQVQA